MNLRIFFHYRTLKAIIIVITLMLSYELVAAQKGAITSRVSSAQKAPIMVRSTGIPANLPPIVNIKQDIPVYLGTITIANSAGAPSYALSTFPDMGLSTGPNVILNTKNPVDNKPVSGLLNPADAAFVSKNQITLQSTINPSNYFTISMQYNSDKNSLGETVGRLLTIVGTIPTTGGSGTPCTIQLNLQNLLNRFAFLIPTFFFLAINISFDTSGSFLNVDSIDVCWVENSNSGEFQRIDTIFANTRARSLDLRTIMLDSQIMYNDCASSTSNTPK
ncbi:MAG TPA: hypothetical protein VHO47_01185 [Candidatus Babeliales bacterium]|nr:hypothetical protein [Candidatus Babeliales bacterium]